MKKYFMILMLAGTMFFVSGCGDKSYHTSDGGGDKSDGSYYTFDGGCVNLHHVKVLSSGIEFDVLRGKTQSKGGITSDNVNGLDDDARYRAYIAFDGVKVYLGDDRSKWVSEYQRVEKQFKSLSAQ